MSTPDLWCHLGSNVNLWPLFARRSEGLDLFIHMYDITGQYRMVAQEEFDAMFQDPTFHERVREITFEGAVHTFVQLFNRTPHRPPRLISLSFTNWSTGCVPSYIPTGFITSCLKKLKICDLCFDLDSIVGTRNLTRLSLIANPCGHSFDNRGKLLTVLRANPLLEYLHLTGVFRDPLPEHGLPPIPLPHLRTINMRDRWTRSQFSQFFECLKLSANIEEIKLTSTSAHESHENLACILTTVYPAIPPDRVQHLLIRESSSFGSAFHYRKFPSDDTTLPQTAPFLILKSGDILESPHHNHLGELERYNLLSNLSHLEVKIFLWRPDFQPIFEMTKKLEKLTVWTWNYCRHLFDVLSPEAVGSHSADNTEEASLTSPARVQLLLPALRELTVIEAKFRSSKQHDSRTQLENAGLSCFRARKQHGSPLEILKLVACHCVDHDWVEELEEVIEEVFWDGLEDGYSSDEDGEDSSESTHSRGFGSPVGGSQKLSAMLEAYEASSDEGFASPQSNDASSDEEREDLESEWTDTSDNENYFLHDSHSF